jgi:hypothetical protein
MTALGRELGRMIERTMADAPLGRRVRLGVGGAISAAGFAALAAQAAQVVRTVAA